MKQSIYRTEVESIDDAISQAIDKWPLMNKRAQEIVKAVKSHNALVKALRQMLTFSDGRMEKGLRTIEEASFADYASDLLAEAES